MSDHQLAIFVVFALVILPLILFAINVRMQDCRFKAIDKGIAVENLNKVCN